MRFAQLTAMGAASVLIAFSATQCPAQQHQQPHEHRDHAHHAHPVRGPHGGVLATVGDYRVETVVQPQGLFVVLYDSQGQLVMAKSARGSVELKVGENPQAYPLQLQPLPNGALGVAVDLSKVVGHPLHLTVQVEGIAETPLHYQATTRIGGVTDALLIALQKTCPVTGKPLGSMGSPPKIMVDGKPLMVCCAGCRQKAEANGSTYLAKYYAPVGKEVRPGVFEATLADAEAIAAQGSCPVMDEPLGGMGTPLKVNVRGNSVYLCCAGCAKRLTAEPDAYLEKLAQQGVKPPRFPPQSK
ncbi:MAG: hypothetical protein KatS3mg111_2562 [Pirellulaceae bacterium]|nr:MAG: hypothetical protein KatS3mg111_2562 [Pirellulaceae bacterium]